MAFIKLKLSKNDVQYIHKIINIKFKSLKCLPKLQYPNKHFQVSLNIIGWM